MLPTCFSRLLPSRCKRYVFVMAFVAASIYFLPHASAASKLPTGYGVAMLGTLDNPGSSAVVRRVNSLGEAVGGFKNGKTHQTSAAFILSNTAGFDEITDQQSTDFSALYGINDRGEVAGAINGPNSVLPFRAVRHTGFQILPLLDRDTSGAAYGINDQGESAGFSGGPSGLRAVWWTRKGDISELPSLPGYTTTKALDINSKGDIVGYAGDGDKVAVVWPAKGNIISLDNLYSFTSSQAESVSENGDVVGSATAFDPNSIRMRAVLWLAGSSTPQDLGALPGGSTSRARDIDSNGIAVGTSNSASGNRAFIWTSADGMRDLNSLSNSPNIVLIDAISVNKQGAILALGINRSDLPSSDTANLEEHELPRQVVLLTPIK